MTPPCSGHANVSSCKWCLLEVGVPGPALLPLSAISALSLPAGFASSTNPVRRGGKESRKDGSVYNAFGLVLRSLLIKRSGGVAPCSPQAAVTPAPTRRAAPSAPPGALLGGGGLPGCSPAPGAPTPRAQPPCAPRTPHSGPGAPARLCLSTCSRGR